MAIPHRGFTKLGETYFITANAIDKKNILQSDRMAGLLVEVFMNYRAAGHYLLHEYVIMPNHLHLLLTPRESKLEKCMQFIKGNFSYRAKKELSFVGSVWQGSYYDRRVRTPEEYHADQHYIHQNPVTAGLCPRREDWPWSSAAAQHALDDVPEGLKPHSNKASGPQS
jgi:putative transposase